jgi:predicted XRE-type DNA-binding protein
MATWKPVYGFEDSYEISSEGQVRSLRPVNLSQRTLSDDQVELIKRMTQEGFSSRKIAPVVGVSQPIVSKILRGAAYKPAKRNILMPACRRDGYLFVTLSVNGKHSHKTVHGMVAEAFIGHRPPNCHVNHKDGNKHNNKAENLEYVSRKGNAIHALYELGKAKKLTVDQAKDIWYAKQNGEKRADVAAKHGVSIHMVSAIWMGKSWWHAR